MNATGHGGVGAVGVSTEVMDEITPPALSPHAMSVKEAIKIADKWAVGWKETPGGLQEVLSVLVDHIVTTEGRLKGIQKSLVDSQDRIQALSLDLAIKENRT